MSLQHELARQQALLAALRRPGEATALAAPMRRGLQAHAANAQAAAERALAATFPTVRALMGEPDFAALARGYWRAGPAPRGDLAWLGERLPAFMADCQALAERPWLADVARLDFLLDRAEHAADAALDAASLALLATHEPAQLALVLRPGTALMSSAYAVAGMWQAVQRGQAPAAPRRAIEHVLVWREGWRARAVVVGGDEAHWLQGQLRGAPLEAPPFDFEPWLTRALQHGWLVGVRVAAPAAPQVETT